MKLWSSTLQTEIKPFMDDNFLLENKMAEVLFHEYARDLPIIDYHCHLPPDQIASNHRFEHISEAWLDGDHYKWRAMRTLGIDEQYITGQAHPYERFEKWAYTVPFTVRNPLFHWTHLELRRYFDAQQMLSPSTAREVYDSVNYLLGSDEYRVQGLLEKMRVETVCTTDDPVDDLEHHVAHAASGTGPLMLPAFRPDRAILIEKEGFNDYISQLSAVAEIEINSLQSLLDALQARVEFFDANGCGLSDHGLEQIYSDDFTDGDADLILRRKLEGHQPSNTDARTYMSCVLHHLAVMYHAHGWVQQFHLGALRNNNARMERELGPDTGFDSIGDFQQASALSRFLNRLDNGDTLTQTVIYNLNPRDNEVMATMVGNYNDGSIKGKMQFGSAWWFLDQKDGMEKQMNALSNMGMLSCFIGMLTDSRSFLSFPRHEYFRRILCNLIGSDVHSGQLPDDAEWLGKIVSDICYYNAKNYFDFQRQPNS